MNQTGFDWLARTIGRRGLWRRVGGALVGACLTTVAYRPATAYDKTCERFLLSGSKNPKREIDVDDDLIVFLNGESIFRDRDRVIGINLVAIEPIRFRANVGDKLRIVAKDGEGPCRSLSPLWLHCREGGSPRRLTVGVAESCVDGRPPRKFFDETFKI